MDRKATARPIVFPKFKEEFFILLLCFLAAVHVFVFSAAFPFFNNVDEPWHFDLVVKYSQGHVPNSLEPMSAESTYYMANYNSLAYLAKSNLFLNGQFP